MLGLQGLHHASLCNSNEDANSRIRAHWARPMQCSEADALDDNADTFDEDAPLLSGMQLTESLQREACTAADLHSQICRGAAQVRSSLQFYLVSTDSRHMTAVPCCGSFKHAAAMLTLLWLFMLAKRVMLYTVAQISKKPCKAISSVLKTAQSLCCRKLRVHLWGCPSFLRHPSMFGSCFRIQSPRHLTAPCSKSCDS